MITQITIVFAMTGLLIGFILGRVSKTKQHGVFVLDDSEDAEEKWTLRLFVDPNDLPNGKNAHFKVIHETQRSCE